MIVRAEAARFVRFEGSATRLQARVARDNGITDFDANLVRLAPGETSSERHWHEREDEVLVVVAGRATVIEEDGAHLLGPGDMAIWPKGVANAHHVRNDGDDELLFLVVGSSPEIDVTHYPDSGRSVRSGG